jgi:hypothetical protein
MAHAAEQNIDLDVARAGVAALEIKGRQRRAGIFGGISADLDLGAP